MNENRKEIEVVNDKCKIFEIDLTKFNGNVTPNCYIGINKIGTRLQWRTLGS